MTILASDQARTFVRERGGRLYVWTGHRCCGGRLTFLSADTARPPGWKRESDPIDAGGFDLFFDAGGHGVPQDLTLEVHGRRLRIRGVLERLCLRHLGARKAGGSAHLSHSGL